MPLTASGMTARCKKIHRGVLEWSAGKRSTFRSFRRFPLGSRKCVSRTVLLRLWYVATLVVTMTAGCSTSRGPSCATSSALVEKTISARARELEGTEYCKFRRYEDLYDLDGDGIKDLVVLFHVEGTGGGGNNVISFMAVFPSRIHWGPLVVETGARAVRFPIAIDIKERMIVLETQEYVATDPLCCPSGKGELVYELQNGVLRRVN